RAFFNILDTISDDFLMGTLFTILLGMGIVVAFSVTKLYTQIISNIHSFRILEQLFFGEVRQGNNSGFISSLLNFQDLPLPKSCCPLRISSLLFAFGFIYVMSWIYLIVFSEALFFISWSAGVDLPINAQNLLLLPTLALAIPFSARVMAYLRYPYTQDYADFMPGAVFVLLIVVSLGYLYQSDDQKFFITQVVASTDYLIPFLKNGVFLAFIPVFFEAVFWMYQLNEEEKGQKVDEEEATDKPESCPDKPVEGDSKS
ncbi:MAG: hypothetical protein GY731_12655, partial [Gammaproteobacteria bacterium]|nr:hypothetical protein [Gammaproteobacteria bacterium]